MSGDGNELYETEFDRLEARVAAMEQCILEVQQALMQGVAAVDRLAMFTVERLYQGSFFDQDKD